MLRVKRFVHSSFSIPYLNPSLLGATRDVPLVGHESRTHSDCGLLVYYSRRNGIQKRPRDIKDTYA